VGLAATLASFLFLTLALMLAWRWCDASVFPAYALGCMGTFLLVIAVGAVRAWRWICQ
jgi:hypothetical protein